MSRLRSDAQLEEKELSGCSKAFWFFSSKLSLDLRISSCSSSLISSLWKSTAPQKIFAFLLTMTSLLWEGIFSDTVICLFKKYEYKLYTHKHYWKDLHQAQRSLPICFVTYFVFLYKNLHFLCINTILIHKLGFVLILWIVCNVPLYIDFLNVLTLLCYVMLILVYD